MVRKQHFCFPYLYLSLEPWPIKRTWPWESEAQIVVPSLDHLASKTGPWPWVLPCSSIMFRCLKSIVLVSRSQTMMWPSWAAVNKRFMAKGWGSRTKMSFSWPVKVLKSVPIENGNEKLKIIMEEGAVISLYFKILLPFDKIFQNLITIWRDF